MTHIPLPDLDRMTGAPAAAVEVLEERLDMTAHEFADATSESWRFTPLHGKSGFGEVTGQMWSVGEWLFSEVALPATLLQVDASHIQDAGALISLERFLTGQERGVEEKGNAFAHGPGMIDFWDEHQSFESYASERLGQDITLPRDLIGLPNEEPISRPYIYQNSTIGRLVFAEWDDVFADLKQGARGVSQIKLDRLAAVLKIAAGAHPEREDIRQHARVALFREICRFIEKNLERPDLSTSVLLDQFGVSRATLYRMFEPLGGVRNYLTERRAASALFDISKGGAQRGFVLAACERWGFSSPANFNRTIQRLFGNSPKALLTASEMARLGVAHTSEFLQTYVSARHSALDGLLPNMAAA
ncbi:MAG: AraC family transcriptional regulator [Pseudomonadota bacterium]